MEIDEEYEYADAPAGFIPPLCREYIYAPQTEEDKDIIRWSMKIYDEGSDLPREPTDEEINKIKKVIGVRDTRTGEIHWNQS